MADSEDEDLLPGDEGERNDRAHLYRWRRHQRILHLGAPGRGMNQHRMRNRNGDDDPEREPERDPVDDPVDEDFARQYAAQLRPQIERFEGYLLRGRARARDRDRNHNHNGDQLIFGGPGRARDRDRDGERGPDRDREQGPDRDRERGPDRDRDRNGLDRDLDQFLRDQEDIFRDQDDILREQEELLEMREGFFRVREESLRLREESFRERDRNGGDREELSRVEDELVRKREESFREREELFREREELSRDRDRLRRQFEAEQRRIFDLNSHRRRRLEPERRRRDILANDGNVAEDRFPNIIRHFGERNEHEPQDLPDLDPDHPPIAMLRDLARVEELNRELARELARDPGGERVIELQALRHAMEIQEEERHVEAIRHLFTPGPRLCPAAVPLPPEPIPSSSSSSSPPPPSEPMESVRTTAAQALILVVDEGCKLKGYVLFGMREQIVFPNVCRLFTENGLQILVNKGSYPKLEAAASDGQVEVIEMLVTEGILSETRAFVETYNRAWVNALLDLNYIVQYEAEFCCFNEIRSAIDKENQELLDSLLACGPDIRHRYPKGGTLLHLAVNRSDELLVRLLLDRGADVNAKRSDHSTALHLAALKGHEDIFRLLLKGGANVNVTMTGSKADSTPLHLAAANGHLKIVEELLLKGADINAAAFSDTGLGGATALHMAVEKHQAEIVELLLEKGANVNSTAFFEKTALLLAVEEGRPNIVKTILSYRPAMHDPSNARAYRLALTSADENSLEITNMLTDYGFTVGPADVGEKELLHGAIRKNQVEVVRMLLYHGTDVNETYGDGFSALTPLHAAAQAAKEGVLRLLLQYGANVNAPSGQGKTPIFDAVAAKNLTAIKLFLDANASIEDIPTYLITACDMGLEDIVHKLLRRGADANVKNSQGETPLFICTRKPRVVKDLLRHGARVNATSNSNRTPLHEACVMGTAKVVEILLYNGADVEAKCDMNRTPIFYAALRWDIDTLKVLGRFNARVDLRDRERKTIFNHCNRGHCFGKPLTALLNYHLTATHLVNLIQERHRLFRGQPALPPRNFLGAQDQGPRNLRERIRNYNQVTVSTRRHQECISKLERHAVKMKATGLFFAGATLNDMSLCPRDFLEQCRAEIERLKTTPIGVTFVSFYDILTHGENQLARYARNEAIVNVLNSSETRSAFPIYGDHLKCQFEKGVLRKELLGRCVRICDWMFHEHSPLPYEVKERILTYLSNKDLGHLIYTSRLKGVFS